MGEPQKLLIFMGQQTATSQDGSVMMSDAIKPRSLVGL
jgi:hypothetical protein